MGGSSGGGGVVPFNMAALAPFLPSVFGGPYNAKGAQQNEQMIAQKYPWITPPAGQFAGAQPGAFAASSTGNSPAANGGTTGISGVPPAPAPSPPIPPTVPPGGGMNPQALAQGGTNPMQPNSLQAILAVLGGGAPSAAGGQ